MTSAIEILQPRNVGGRPSKYEPRFCELVVDFCNEGHELASFAANIGVCRKTLVNWCQQHPEFFEACERAKARCTAWWINRARDVALGKGGPGAASMIQFALKNLDPDGYQDRAQLEHIGRIQHQTMSHQEALEEAARRGIPPRLLEE